MKQNLTLFFKALLVFVCFFCQSAHATERVFEFRGTITTSNIGGFPVGTPFVARLSYDDAQAPTGSGSTFAYYSSFSFTLTLTGLNFSTNPANHRLTVENVLSGSVDRLAYRSILSCGEAFDLLLTDIAGSAFNSANLPSSLTLADFELAEVRFYTDGCDPFSTHWDATITSITAITETSTVLMSSSDLSCSGDAVNFTAWVTGNGIPVTTGTVTFTEGATILAADVALDANGQAVYTTSTLNAGPHTITATYNETGGFLTSSASAIQAIITTPVFSITPSVTCLTASATVSLLNSNPVGPIAIVNPDFEILYKAGSTTVTAPQVGYVSGPAGLTSSGMTGPSVTFSDGSSGDQYDMAGWNWNIEAGAPGAFFITNLNGFLGSTTRNNIAVLNGAGFIGADGAAERTMSQVLTSSLEQGATYTLTADFGWRNDNGIPTMPAVLRLYAGNTLLTPVSSSNPPFVQGDYVTWSQTYMINSPLIAGALKIEIGLGDNTDGQQLQFDHVSLAKTANGYAYFWNTTPVQTTPTATGLTYGTYTVTVSAPNGCSASSHVTITPPPPPVLNIVSTPGCGVGSATVFVQGNTSTGPIAVVNPDFEILYKAGSTTVTAPALGFIEHVTGLTNTGMTGPTVTFSDGSSGDQYDMAGWNWNIAAGATGAFFITNLDGAVGSTTRNNIAALNGAGFIGSNGAAERTMNQVLTSNLEQGSTYVLTADFGWRNDNSIPTLPPVLRLYAGSTLLTPVSSSNPPFVQGDYVTWSLTYTVNDPLISGALKVEIGLGANANGQQLDFDHVTLAKTAEGYSYSWNTDPVQTTATATGLTDGTYTVTVTASNGCTASSNVTITNNPVPTAVATPASQTVCSGSAMTTIALTGAVSGTTYNWTRNFGDVSSGTVMGIAASGSGNISGTLTNVLGNDLPVVFTITPTINGCTGTPVTATVLVKGRISIGQPLVIQPTCAVSTGTIRVNASAESLREYSINGGTSWSSSNEFNSLAPGSYNIQVRYQDNPACVSSYSSNPVVLVAATNCCTLTCPANIIANNKTGYCGAYVTYPAAVKSEGCGSATLSYSKASGSFFNVGVTTVTVTSSTGATCSFTITVKDIQKPVITSCPSNITVNAASNSCSKVVTFSTTATDNCPGVIVTASPASGTAFPAGTTTVTITAKDASNNITTSTFTVTVKETVKPVISCPANITANTTSGLCTAIVNPGTATATDNCSAVTITSTRSDNKALTAVYPLGNTTITWKAKDASGNYATCQQKITVKDLEPPVISNASASSSVLWPADRNMKTVLINYSSIDNCSSDCSSGTSLTVTSNEPISGTYNGDLSPDWQIINNRTVKLRAERKPTGTGRIYTIKISSTDANGNVSTKTVTVSVPIASPYTRGGDDAPLFTTTDDNSNEYISSKLGVQVSPNPGSYYFNLTVKTSNPEPINIRVIDLAGRMVKQINAIKGNSARFGEDLKPGTYLLEVRQGNEKQVLKVIKL